MENDLIQVKSFGHLRPETLYTKDVSLSIDTTQFSPSSEVKVMVQIEPPEVINITQSIINYAKEFDLILAWDERILQSCPNAKRFIFGTCWVEFDELKLDKQNEISFIMSNKRSASGHQLRHAIWSMYGEKDRIGNFNFRRYKTPPRLVNKKSII